MIRRAVSALALALGLPLVAAPVFAHPLGNFTINHLTKIASDGRQLSVRYILDMAEIPTFATMRERDPSGRMTGPELAAWSTDEARALAPQLAFEIDGKPLALVLDSAHARTLHGAGGLPTLYLVATFHAKLPSGRVLAVSYQDRTFAGRLGWKDVVAAPGTEPTHELTSYPNALLGSPRNTTAGSFNLAPTGALESTSAASAVGPAGGQASVVRSNQLSDMLARGTSNLWFVALTLLIAVALGGLHALEPGHGKTLLAVSLVGARATVGQAAVLAGSLTVAHTIGVLALGFAIIALKGAFVPESVYPWITLASGVVIAIIGARAVARQVMTRMPFAHAHAHGHAHAHAHEHEHVHKPGEQPHAHAGAPGHAHDELEHARSHAIGGTAPLRFGPTVWAAMSGGIAPCPAALVVLFAAIAQNVLVYGLVAIVFFSFGLAATLTGLGIGVVRGASWLSARPQFARAIRFGPLVSAIVIATIGAIMVGQGFAQQGIPISAPLITILIALAIAGYAFSHPLAHARSAQTI